MSSQNGQYLMDALNYLKDIQQNKKSASKTESIVSLGKLLKAIENSHIDGEIRQAVISIITPEGKNEVNIFEDCGYVFHHFHESILKDFTTHDLEKYIDISLEFLLSANTPIKLKIQLVDSENQFAREALFSIMPLHKRGSDAIISRYSLCKQAFSGQDPELFQQNGKILSLLANDYIAIYVDSFVSIGKLLQAASALDNLLKISVTDDEKRILITNIISHCSSFNLTSTVELNELIENYKYLFTDHQIQLLRSQVNFKPGGMIVEGLKFSRGNLSISSTKNKAIVTLIQFSIPHKISGIDYVRIPVNERVSIYLFPVHSFWSDPMFRMMKTFKVANMGWSYFCDVEPDCGSSYTHVYIIIDDLYIPDVQLTEEYNQSIDFSDKEAMIGRRYYPHKEFIVKLFRDNCSKISDYLELDISKINIDVFSNYCISYIEKSTNRIIYDKFFAITNPSSFSTVTTRFIERLNSINLAESLISIRELLTNTKVETEKNLAEFTYRAFDIFVKHNIEQHGGYTYLWKNNSTGKLIPRTEPESQPYIFNLLRAVFDFMGIQISREVVSSNGEIDFLVTYTDSANTLLRVCVELKLAHSNKVENGVTLQLPAYMKGERCRYGIYVILWFKCSDFDKPTQYQSVQGLDTRIKEINTNDRISSMVVDCTKPVAPSAL